MHRSPGHSFGSGPSARPGLIPCLLLAGLLSTSPAPAAPAPPAGRSDRIDLHLDTSEARAVLAILDKRAGGHEVTDTDWKALFTSEPYVRLKKREAEIGKLFNAPGLAFTDEQFRAFVLQDSLVPRAAALRRALDEWSGADLRVDAGKALAYLPDDARIHAKIYPVIKPRTNSFVFEPATDAAIFLYLDPARTRAKFENTVAHELHHIGFASVSARRDSLFSGLSKPARDALQWVGAFGEGFAMLAAAGGPGVHPHAVSPPGDRARWDRDMAHFNRDVPEVQKFLLDVAEGRLVTDEEQGKAGSTFYGVQGPWYTVGWKMATVIEKRYGRPRLVECMMDLRQLLPTYNRAAEELNRAGAEKVATWSPELIDALAATGK